MSQFAYDVTVVGAGPAGLAAAIAAKRAGADRVVIIERDTNPGGILQQCIHTGFGLKYFKEELTGPEYAHRFIQKAEQEGIEFIFGTMALEIRKEEGLICSNSSGLLKVSSGAIVLAMGCRERTRGNLQIPGSRPAGIYTAGTAQKLVNIYGHLVGKKLVILGSGDIGMIMARRMTLEGAKVEAVVEILPYLAGLKRNKVQCLDDFEIPLLLSHTVTEINGIDRVESVTIAKVDENLQPIVGESRTFECDTLLLSVGLIPENELSKSIGIKISSITKGASVNQYMQTEIPNIFMCGNVLHVNDLVDNVSMEGEIAGKSAALYSKGLLPEEKAFDVIGGNNVRYVCPHHVSPDFSEDVNLFFRVSKPGGESELTIESGGEILAVKKMISVNPGEIEYLTIKKEDKKRLADTITVHVHERSEQI